MVGLREPQRWDYGVPDSGEDVMSYSGPYHGGQVTVCVYVDRLLHTCAQLLGRGGVECSLWSAMRPACDGYLYVSTCLGGCAQRFGHTLF